VNILFVSPSLPIPVSGGRTRIFYLIRQLSISHAVSLLSFIQPADDGHTYELESFCRRVVLVPLKDFHIGGRWSNRIKGWGQILSSSRPQYANTYPVEIIKPVFMQMICSEEYDVIVFEHLFLVELCAYLNNRPALLIEHNVESDLAAQKARRATNPIHGIRDFINWYLLFRFEKHWLKKFPICVAVSPEDAKRIGEIAPGRNVIVVPNGVDTEYFKPIGNNRNHKNIIFFGSLRYGPNIDALEWFCYDIWPTIYETQRSACFEIIGLQPSGRVEKLSSLPGVLVTGFVPDIRPKLWDSVLTVVPLRIGGGTRLKILEAMAAECPVISTTIGAEGLDIEPGNHLLVADTRKVFADTVLRLLSSPGERALMSQSARQHVVDNYDWKVIAPRLEYALEKTLEFTKVAAI